MRYGDKGSRHMKKAEYISFGSQLYWSIRRELLETRSIYLAPAAVAVLIIIGSAISSFRLPGRLTTLDPAQQHEVIEQPYEFAAMLLMFTTIVIAFYYCLETFQSERRDRSILFWKSLPVPDFTTAAAKASVPLLILPIVTFAATVVTHVFMLSLGSAWQLFLCFPCGRACSSTLLPVMACGTRHFMDGYFWCRPGRVEHRCFGPRYRFLPSAWEKGSRSTRRTLPLS
jgi:ABC-2 type transport system permease protein